MVPELIKWIGFVLGALLLQTTLVPSVEILGVRPDLTLLVLFFVSVRFGIMPGIWVGFALGLAQDVYAASPMLGQAALAKTLCGAFFGFFNERTMRTDALVKAGIIFAGFFIHDALFHGTQLVHLAHPLSTLPLILLARTLPAALFSLVLAAVVYAYITVIRPNLRR